MEVFVSWSGSTSKEVAKTLKKWIPRSLLGVKLFVSDTDIRAGDRWSKIIGDELAERKFAIVCLTSDNAESAWLNFEAGAISKTISDSYVVPFLFNVELSNIDGPLTQFQAKKVNREGYFDLLKSINAGCENPIAENELEETLDIFWPNIEEDFKSISEDTSSDDASRDTNAILSDVIFSINDLREQMSFIESKVNPTVSPTSRLELLSNLFQSASDSCSPETLREIARFCRAEINKIFLERVLSDSELAYGKKLRETLAQYS